MISNTGQLLSRIALIVAITSCYLVVDTEQRWKWHKPYAWNGPQKYTQQHQQKQQYTAVAHKSLPQHMLANDKFKSDNCELRKAVFNQETDSPQYVVYKTKIPDLKEFTLCHWHTTYNYTHDQPIFSYTHQGKPRAIYSWIENSPEKTYYSLAINGHTIYRINYPEKLFKWYHVCQSWNGYTGEWQLWINVERVGRGFYNLMVGKEIKGGGVAISGREYLEQALAVHFPGFSGELTQVFLYKAALTAGKAYNDHKHHHVHNFHHGYDESVDEAEMDGPAPQPEAAEPEPTRPPQLAHGGMFANGQRLPKLPVMPVGEPAGPSDTPPRFDEQRLFDGGLYDFYAPFRDSAVTTALAVPAGGDEDDGFRVNLLDRWDHTRQYKRNATGSERTKRWTPLAHTRTDRSSGNAHERKSEPAEWEVKLVSEVCGACQIDPFRSASVMSWHETKKQFYNGVLYLPALPQCYLF